MSRSPASRTALLAAAVTATLAAGTAVPSTGAAQEAPVLDLELPVQDLVLTVVSLDGSIAEAEVDRDVRITLAADVLFAFDRATLAARARPRLEQARKRIADEGPARVRVVGYTDAKGDPAYNRALSRRRAAAVAGALRRRLGGTAVELTVEGRGEADPVAPNAKPDGSDDPRGRALNRRVTVTFVRG